MASVDTPEDNKGFAEKEKADFPILSDPGKQVATAYGVVTPERPLPMRHTFYIGPDGTILFIDKAVKPQTAGEDVRGEAAGARRQTEEIVSGSRARTGSRRGR